jgi:hypothetical protein
MERPAMTIATRRAWRWSRALGWSSLVLGLAGCLDGPSPIPTYPSQGSSDSGSTSSATSSSSSSSTAAADDTRGSTGPINDSTFLGQPDVGEGFECSIYAQDCPDGRKCMFWSTLGGRWDAVGCKPVAADPVEIGEVCHVEGSPVSGVDDCEVGVMCWSVDSETLEGICVPLCVGDESHPICEDPNRWCAISSSALVLCVPVCNPLQDDCAEGQGCYPFQDSWNCAPDASGDMGAYGDPCEFLDVCDPGLICLGAGAVPPGEACEGSAGCCSEVCNLTDPACDLQCAGAAGGQTCQSWYEEGAAWPGFENVGACALPG